MYSKAGNEYIEETIKKYSSSMLKTAFSLLKSTADAEDAVQEAFIKLISIGRRGFYA